MILYFFLLLLTGVVTGLALGWVSGKPGNAVKNADASSSMHSDMVIYRKQMTEIGLEKDQGLLDEVSAEEARLELARRILDAEKKTQKESGDRKRTWVFRLFLNLTVLFLPVFTWSVYLLGGSPDMPSHPFSMLLARDPAKLDRAEKLVRAEVLSNRNPQDGQLVDELAALYLAGGRFQDAVNTYNRAIAMNGQSAARLLAYAMALTGFEGGVVSTEAENAFREVARLDPQNPDAQIFLARGLLQNGRKAEAVTLLEDFLQSVPADRPWRKDLASVVANLKKEASPAGAVKPAMAVSAQQRQFIATNIDKLAARLAAQPEDLQGWMMLVNAHLILEQKDRAEAAAQKGLHMLPAEEAARLTAFARQKGLMHDNALTGKKWAQTATETAVE